MSELVERVARKIYIAVDLNGDERGNRDHIHAVFSADPRFASYEHYRRKAQKAAEIAIAEVLDWLHDWDGGAVTLTPGEVMLLQHMITGARAEAGL